MQQKANSGGSWKSGWFAAIVFSVAAIYFFPSAATAEPEVVEKRKIGDWLLRALHDTSPGVTKGVCLLSLENRDSLILNFAAERPTFLWFVALADRDWQLTAGTEYEITYVITGEEPVTTTARAVSRIMISMPLGKSFGTTEPFQHGRSVEFRTTEGYLTKFSLDGAKSALEALRDCAIKRLEFSTDN